MKAVDENYFDLMLNNEFAENHREDGNLTPINDRHSILHEPVSEFHMCFMGKYPYTIFPLIFTLNSVLSLEASKVPSIQRNPNFSLYGQGVLVGFVDTGIDYRHKAFLNRDGSSRIVSIWDQTIESEKPPAGFSFGTEYTKESINLALRSADPASVVPSRDDNGHGTMLAGIAAGSQELEHGFWGIASSSELIVVKLKQAKKYNRKIFCVRDGVECYLETDIMLGIQYLRRVAVQLKRPLAICIGVGSSQGSHIGGGPFGDYINNLATYPGTAVCISAGNEGNNRRHYRGKISSPSYEGDFELRVGEKDQEFFFELWNYEPYRLNISISTPTRETTKVIHPRFDECLKFQFVFGPTTVFVNNFILEEETGAQLIVVRFQNAMQGIWRIKVSNIDFRPADFDVWLPSGEIISKETYFLEASPETTVTSPGNTINPLTVTAYNQQNKSILLDSSRGFSASRTAVPDLAAPGYQILCPVPGGGYGSGTGTGAAAAHACGIAAMVLEWGIIRGNYDTITGRDVSRLLVRGAARSNSMVYPNPVWGYGSIDILGLFNWLRL